MKKKIEKDVTKTVDPATGDAVTDTTTIEQPAPPATGNEGGNNAAPADASATMSIDDIRAMVAEKFGQTFDNDSDLLAFIAEKLDAVGGYEASDAKIQEVLTEYPELLSLVEDLGSGVPFRQALAANIDIDDLRAEEGDEDYAAVEEANKKRRDRAKRAKDYEAQLAANMEQSAEILSQFFEEQGMTDEQADDYTAWVDGIINDYIDGKVTKDMLTLFQHARNYDVDIASARESGAIEGKNAKVDAERERRAKATDGMPQGGSAIAVEEDTPKEDDVFAEIGRNNRRNWR